MHNFTHLNLSSMKSKTIVITGGNTGLGFEVANQFAAHDATVIIACRSASKANIALKNIRAANPNADISSVILDLGSLDSVRGAARELLSLPKLDILINNAGIMMPPYELTVDGFESQFAVNHLGPFALTGLLTEALYRAPSARVVNTSSLAALSGKLMFDDLNANTRYNALERYSMSKLANLVFSNELNRRFKFLKSRVTSVGCHPGIATTDLSRHLPSWFKVFEPAITHLFNSPLQGAWPTLLAATDMNSNGGEFYGPSRFRQTSGPARQLALPKIKNEKVVASKLWRVSEELTGVYY